MNRIELDIDEIHQAVVDWLKAHRPEVYAENQGREAAFYATVVRGELVAVGFEVDE